TCQNGACVGSNPVVCTAQDQCHGVGVCDPGTGLCSNPAKADGTACNDGNACTQNDTCRAGVCTAGAPLVCPAPDHCHDTCTCNPSTGQCSNPPKADGTTCDDGNPCTQNDICRSGVCTAGTPIICALPDVCHDAGICDPPNGSCSYQPKADGTSC